MPEPTYPCKIPHHRMPSPEQKLVDDLYTALDEVQSYEEKLAVRECIELVLIYLNKIK